MNTHIDIPFRLSKEEMRSFGYKIIDIITEHFDNLHEKNLVSLANREQMDALLNQDLPEKPTDKNEVLNIVTEKILTNIDLLTHPKFYSFVPSPGNFISTMADALVSGFNVFSGGWSASPAAAELEIVVINWLLELFNFPVKTGGGILTSGGSMANLTALTTARRIKCGDDYSKSIIYLSDQAHSSNIKAIRVLGFKKRQVRILPTDSEFKISINQLKNEIAKDKLAGYHPFCLIASAGTTNTGTVDPLETMATICKRENLWFHIDGAYGGAAILSDAGKEVLKGIEKADSLTIDPHKWLFQPYEIGCLLVKNHKWLSATFSEKPVYLRDVEGNDSEINFYDHGIQLTRGFRALKLYMSIKTFGITAFKDAINKSILRTEELEDKLRESPLWQVVSPATLAIINFRYNPLELSLTEEQLSEINQYISRQIIKNRYAVLVTTILNDQVVLRMCLINPCITMEMLTETISQCEKFGNQFVHSFLYF
ncbi:MAG: decarboxylase [Flavobacteriales bacterium]|nr:MAG: decarboxylase [Flavobacteriales bacterium]